MSQRRRIKAKQDILDRVAAALDYLPDDPAEASFNRPWFAQQLNMIVRQVTHDYINVYESMSAIAVLGLPFSRQLSVLTDPPGSHGITGQAGLRAV